MTGYDAVVVVSFGGPEGPEDVLPFLERVTAGRGIPRERLAEVGAHYDLFGGVSPINRLNRELIAALRDELARAGLDLPVYWGNRNWHPLLADAVREMRDDGVTRALAFVTSAYGSYSACRQYLDDIERARAEVGAGAPAIDKLRLYYDHPGFVDPLADGLAAALEQLPPDAAVVFSAHSIPVAMAEASPYVEQLSEAARLVAERGAPGRPWDLVYQSRSGPPSQPWLEPDVLDHLDALAAAGAPGVALVPVGFTADHMEVLFDLDTQARERAAELGLPLVRVPTSGSDPRFVAMVRELVQERVAGAPRRALGRSGPWPDACPAGHCPPPARRPPA